MSGAGSVLNHDRPMSIVGMTSGSTRTLLGLLVAVLILAALGITFYFMNKPDCPFEDNPRCSQLMFSQESTDYAGT